MGMYTEVFFRGEIRRDAPAELVDWLNSIVNDPTGEHLPYDGHEFFNRPRWELVFNCSSAYFPTRGAKFGKSYFDADELFVHASLKDYDGEIAAFFDWIAPFVEGAPGDFLGYSLYEDTKNDYDDQESPILHFLPAREG